MNTAPTHIKRDLIIIWSALAITLIVVAFTKNIEFFVPMFVYVIYKSVLGMLSQNKLFIAPFCLVVLVSFAAIYKISTHPGLHTLPYHLYSAIIK